MSERHNSDGTAKSTTASKHALLLNRLVQMQDAPYYATAKDELAWAEKIITGQEDTIEQLQAENARLREVLLESDGWLEYLNPEELPDAQHHKAFDDFAWKLESILASTDKSNWLAEHDAEVQLRILDACWNTVSANQCWEIAAKLGIDIDKLRRMAEQPESK